MRRALKGLAVIIGIAAGSSHAGEIDAARQRELLHLLRHDCSTCFSSLVDCTDNFTVDFSKNLSRKNVA